MHRVTHRLSCGYAGEYHSVAGRGKVGSSAQKSRWRIILPWQLEGSILEFYIHSPSEFWRPGSRLLLKKEGIVVLIVVFQLGC